MTWWQCPAWHGSDSAWHRVTESVTRPSVRLSPPFRLLLSTPLLAGITCNFAKRTEKCSVSVSKYSNAAIFKVQSLWGFPQMSASSPALLERGMSQGRGIQYWRLTLYTSHLHKMFPTLVFCSERPAPPRHNTPIMPWHPNTRYLLLSFSSATLEHQTASSPSIVNQILIFKGYLIFLTLTDIDIPKKNIYFEKLSMYRRSMRDGDTDLGRALGSEGRGQLRCSNEWSVASAETRTSQSSEKRYIERHSPEWQFERSAVLLGPSEF